MKCPRCQVDNLEHLKFCEDCGAALARPCPQCGTPIRSGKKFCGECGTSQDDPGDGRYATPRQYTPKHLAERILMSRDALDGERKQVTVLFADLKGSMELLADRDPEDARRLLDPVIEKMMDSVHRFEGTVNQVMGDGIMALFGAPIAQEDHAVRACYAALSMHEAIRRHAQELRRTEGAQVQIRVGINSGEVVVRSVGSDLRMDYSAVGQTTHLAARMEQLAMPGTTAISGDTLRLVEGYVQVRALGPMQVKGLSAPVDVFELVAAGTARSRIQASVRRGLTSFVGRDAELESLTRAIDAAERGHGQVVGVVGEPGVGKSRLYYEFTRSHRTQDWLVLQAGSVSYGKANAYAPVIDLLKSYFRIEDRDDVRGIREKVAGKLLVLDRELEPLLTPLLYLLEVPIEDTQWLQLDPAMRRQRILAACKRLLFRESMVRGLVLVFEDLHWIDRETQSFLDSVVDSLPTARILLLTNYRPEYEHRWSSRSCYTQIRVAPLSAESAEALIGALLGTDASVAPLSRLLIERTAGNPLFLEEVVRALEETGALAGTRGAWRLTAPLAAIQVPATVQSIILARIDRLAPEDKRLLQVAAAIGMAVPHDVLGAVWDGDERSLQDGLQRLQLSELLLEAHLYPDLEYTFKHALTHEVTYSGLLSDRRKGLHAAILQVSERLYADRLPEQVERLTHHANRAELWDKAYAYARQAGEKALARSASQEAIDMIHSALAAAAQLPETPELLRQMVDLRMMVELPLVTRGEFSSLMDNATAAMTIVRRIDDPIRLARALAFLGEACALNGRTLEALEHGRRSVSLAEQTEKAQLIAMTKVCLGITCIYAGHYAEACDAHQECVAVSRDLIHRSSENQSNRGGLAAIYARYGMVWALVYTAHAHAEMGQFEQAYRVAAEAVEASEALGMRYAIVGARLFSAFSRARKEVYDEALVQYERLLRSENLDETPLNKVWIAAGMGYARLFAGQVSEGLAQLKEASELSPPSQWSSACLAHLAEAYAMSGHTVEAIASARRSIELATERQTPGSQAWGLYSLGRAFSLARRPDVARAEEAFGQSLSLAETLNMRPLAAKVHHRLGEMAASEGMVEKAARHLQTAIDAYEHMGIHNSMEQASRMLAALPRTH
jgi:class 3 adenylate cyclase/tetratricopeptide (TPR) repeat protein